jgi:hypothetical protein
MTATVSTFAAVAETSALLPSEGHDSRAVQVDDRVASADQRLQPHPRDELMKCCNPRLGCPDERRRKHLADRPTGQAQELPKHGIAPKGFDVSEAVFPQQRRHHEGEEDPVAGIHAKATVPGSDLEERRSDIELFLDESDEG